MNHLDFVDHEQEFRSSFGRPESNSHKCTVVRSNLSAACS